MAASYLANKITYIDNAYVYYRRNIQTNLQSSAHKDWMYHVQIATDLVNLVIDSDRFTTIKQDILNIVLNWLVAPIHRFYLNNEFENIKQLSSYLRYEGFKQFGLDNLSPRYIYNGGNYYLYTKLICGKQVKFLKNINYDICNFLFTLYYNPNHILQIQILLPMFLYWLKLYVAKHNPVLIPSKE